jgi:multidrug transporter EmrE-like cation transporter
MALEVPSPEPIAAPPSRVSTLLSLSVLIVSVCFAIAGQYTLKSAMNHIGRFGSAEAQAAGEYIGRALRQPRLWLGLALFGVSAVFWLIVLSRVDLSIAYPFVGVSYIAVVLIGRFLLHEQVPGLRWVGVLVVAAGLAIIGASSRTVAGG